jgi:hypothetical protein
LIDGGVGRMVIDEVEKMVGDCSEKMVVEGRGWVMSEFGKIIRRAAMHDLL